MFQLFEGDFRISHIVIVCYNEIICKNSLKFFKINNNKGKLNRGIQLTLVISNLMGLWKNFESTVVRLKRSYENRKCSLFNDERETTLAKF